MDRRAFLAGGAAAGLAIGGGALVFARRTDEVATRRYGTTTITRNGPSADAPDVLFISLDDCNDWPGFLGNHPGTHTPNLDALAAESAVFQHAYCTAPMCVPARTSVMFGTMPSETGVYDHSETSDQRYADFAPRHASLVDDFWAAGYDVVAGGKVFGDSQRNRWRRFHRTEADQADPAWRSPYRDGPAKPRAGEIDFGPSGHRPDQEPDGRTAEWVTGQLRAPRTRPLFLAYGLISTHLAWRVPQRYFDLHPLDEVVVPEVPANDLDDIGPEGRSLIDTSTQDRMIEAGLWAEAVQAYQAAMSYADDRVGIVLDALASSPRADDTIVAVWSDHGFHLGEKLHWQKFTLWERATRIPMLIRAPGRAPQSFTPPVSALDLGPTIADLSGVPVDRVQQGTTLLPALDRPELADDRPPVTTWLPGNHAVRRDRWRYIRYRGGEAELYDLETDPAEQVNLAGRPELAAVQRELATFLPSPAEEVDFDRPVGQPVAD